MSNTIPLTPVGPRQRAKRRKNFIVHSDPELIRKRRRQEERVRWNRSHAWTAWRWLLGIGACLEFLMYVHEKWTYVAPEEIPQRRRFFFFRRNEQVEEPTIESAVASLVTPYLTVLYILYFIDAFIQAYDMRRKAFRMNEKERLLRGRDKKIVAPWFVFASTLSFNLFLLPAWYWWEMARFFKVTRLFTPSELMKQSIIANPQYSLAYAVFVYTCKNMSASAKAELKEHVRAFVKSQLRTISMFAMKNPRKARRHYQTASGTKKFDGVRFLVAVSLLICLT